MQPDREYVKEWQVNIEAKRLRDRGVSYRAISIVMDEFHGVSKSEDRWRHQLQKQGVPLSKGPRKGQLA